MLGEVVARVGESRGDGDGANPTGPAGTAAPEEGKGAAAAHRATAQHGWQPGHPANSSSEHGRPY